MKQPPTHAQAALERALSAAQRATGSRDDVARLRERLQVAMGAEPPLSAASTVAPLTAAKLWIVSAALLLAGAGLYGLREPAPAERTPTPIAPLLVKPAVAPPAAAEEMPLEAAPSTPVIAAGQPAAKPLARRPQRVTAARESAPSSSGVSEVELISQAQSTLASDPRGALLLLTRHQELFGHGVLSEERDILRFDAERALGMQERASVHARAFMQTYPSSAHRRRVEQWLAQLQEPPASSP